MSFLAINGWSVSVAEASETNEVIGTTARALNGSLRTSRRAIKRVWKVTTVPMVASEARALRGLIVGEGDTWSFDSDLYSAKGVGPLPGYSASISGTGKFGSRALITTLSYPIQHQGAWTVLLYRHNGTVWQHYAVRSDGAKWLDGTRNDAVSTSFLTVASSAITLTGTSTPFDDLVFLPYIVPETAILAFYQRQQPFSPLPTLACMGDLIGGTAWCIGEMGEAKSQPFAQGGIYYADAMELSFTLLEV